MAVIGEETNVYLLDTCVLHGVTVILGDIVIRDGVEVTVTRISQWKGVSDRTFINKEDLYYFTPLDLDSKVDDEGRYVD